jgi:hypothetical protein
MTGPVPGYTNRPDVTRSGGDPNSPTWRSPHLVKWHDARERCSLLYEGTRAVRDARERFLPKMPREDFTEYNIRLELAEVSNFFGGAIRAAVGLVFAKSPALTEAAPAPLAKFMADIDGCGTAFHVWGREVMRLMLRDTGCLAVVGTPYRGEQALSIAQKEQLGLRPYVALYELSDVQSISVVRTTGGLKPVRVVLRESRMAPEGEFGSTARIVYRDLALTPRGVQTQIWAEENGKATIIEQPVVTPGTALPIVCYEATPVPTRPPFASAPPMLELAELTVSHLNVRSDRRWAMKMACYPMLVRIGYTAPEGSETEMGPSRAMDIANPDGKAMWLSPDEHAMTPTQVELEALAREAAMYAAAFMAGQSSVAETATAKAIDADAQDATLAAVAESFRDATDRLFGMLAEADGISGLPADGKLVSIATTFRAHKKDPAMLRVMLDAVVAGHLSTEAFLGALMSGELPADFDPIDEALALMAQQAVRDAANPDPSDDPVV